MRTGSSDIMFRGHRNQSRPDSKQRKLPQVCGITGSMSKDLSRARSALGRRYRARWRRALRLVNLSTPMGNGPGAQEDSPIVAVDPLDPQKIVSVWVNNDTADIPAPDASGLSRGGVFGQWRSDLDFLQQRKFCLAGSKYHQSDCSVFADHQSERELRSKRQFLCLGRPAQLGRYQRRARSSKVRFYGRCPGRGSVSSTDWRFVHIQHRLSVAAGG